MGSIFDLMGTGKSAQNPTPDYTKPMRDNNPGMAEAIAYVNKSGLSPKQAFMKLAKERGLDPNEVMRQFKALR